MHYFFILLIACMQHAFPLADYNRPRDGNDRFERYADHISVQATLLSSAAGGGPQQRRPSAVQRLKQYIDFYGRVRDE